MVQAIELEHCCIGVSIPRVGYSIEVVVEHMVEMTEWLARSDIEMQRTEEV